MGSYEKLRTAFYELNFNEEDEHPPGDWWNIKPLPYQYRDSHYKDDMMVRPHHLHNENSYTSKIISLYWISSKESVSMLTC